MEKEELKRRIFQTLEEVELACFEYIEGLYNSKRPRGFNDMLTPDEKENYFSMRHHYFNYFTVYFIEIYPI
ncbi:IS3 family transposase [Listeria monocytogenes]|nr:IS3 family transposase [Listeria monocytogenes]